VNLFNRVVVILLFLALALALIFVAILPDQFVGWMQTMFNPMSITPLGRVELFVAAAIIVVASVLIVQAEIRPDRRRGVHLAQVKGGMAELSTDSIAGRIKQAAEAMPDVRQVTPSVASRGRSVDVHVGLIANPGIDVSQKANDVVQAVRDLVEKDIGVKVGKLQVNIKYEAKGVGKKE
jgi:uncharacterized alkaline shock family protein YloU